MNRIRVNLSALAVAFVIFAVCSATHAQATRTWVSGVGDDANPCSRTAPCKTFAGAISKTAAGGEINAIDSGGFGAVTITKSIVIDGAGVMASILSSGTNGIIVNSGVNGVVTIRNVSINGAFSAGGGSGIRYLSGKELHVENVVIQNVSGKGIDVTSTTPNSQLFVRDTVIRNAADVGVGGAIHLHPTAPGTVVATLDNVRMDASKFGVRAEDNSKATVRNSVASHSIGNGFLAVSTAAPAEIFLDKSTADSNVSFALFTQGNNAIARISNFSMYNNGGGLSPQPGSQIISFGNNSNANVASPGAPTSTVLPQ